MLDVINQHGPPAGDLPHHMHEALRVIAPLVPHDHHQIGFLYLRGGGVLPLLRRVADVVMHLNVGIPELHAVDDRLRVPLAESGLGGNGQPWRLDIQHIDLGQGLDQVYVLGSLADYPFRFGMAAFSHIDDLVALRHQIEHEVVRPGHVRTGGIHAVEALGTGRRLYRWGDPMGGEDHGADGDLVQQHHPIRAIQCDDPQIPQAIHRMAVMHDLAKYVDRSRDRWIAGHALGHLDRVNDAVTVAARADLQYTHLVDLSRLPSQCSRSRANVAVHWAIWESNGWL